MHCLKILFAAVIATASAAPIRSQTTGWRIDPGHSTARFTLSMSNGKGRQYDLAVAKVAGKLEMNASKPADSALTLSIYPAGQRSNLLAKDGTFQSGKRVDLTDYTVLTFHSNRASPGGVGKLALAGELRASHMQHRTDMSWNDAYKGVNVDGLTVHRLQGEVSCTLEMPASAPGKGHDKSPAEVSSASCAIERAKFPGLWSALRTSQWPLVVLDEVCKMPYYIGPGLKDYTGATCTGTPILTANYDYHSLNSTALENVGTDVPVPPTGDQVVIHVQLRLTRDNLVTGGTGD